MIWTKYICYLAPDTQKLLLTMFSYLKIFDTIVMDEWGEVDIDK